VASGLNKKLRQARWFYALILVSTGRALRWTFIGINPVKALYWTAVINGLLAPFLLVAILIVAADKKLMQGQPSSRLGWIVVAITTIAMFARALRCLLCKPNDRRASGVAHAELLYATQVSWPHRSCEGRSLSRFQSKCRQSAGPRTRKSAESTTSGASPTTGGWRDVHRQRRARR
jgi:hypothetical protein